MGRVHEKKAGACCKNCGAPLQDAWCSHCGQKAIVDRITFSIIWHDLIHFFTHMESGFLYTAVSLLKAPGPMVMNYVEGQRKKYQAPVSYFLIWTTIYILLLYMLEKAFGSNTIIAYKDYFGPGEATHYAISHLNLVLAFVLPFQALYLYLLISRKKWNYAESLVAVIYALGTIIMLQTVFVLIALLFYFISGRGLALQVSDSFKVLYLAWYIFTLVKLFPVNRKIFRAFVFFLLSFGTFTAWRLWLYPHLSQKYFVIFIRMNGQLG